VNIRRGAAVLLLTLSGSAFAADPLVLVANPVGIWLITFGVAFLIAEAALPNYGVICLGGIVMFVIGAVILTNTEVPVPLMIGLGLLSALLLIFLLTHALKTRPRHTVSGDAGLVGSVTPVMSLKPGNACDGWVHLQGEQWQVHSATPLQAGQRVRVLARRGLRLQGTRARRLSFRYRSSCSRAWRICRRRANEIQARQRIVDFQLFDNFPGIRHRGEVIGRFAAADQPHSAGVMG
jgi:membrane-bound serine protease (ClpP class)